MTSPVSPSSHDSQEPVFPLPGLILFLAASAFITFVLVTPAGLLNKADIVGYAVCHRGAAHSFSVGGRQLPLCARCTGTFIGALTGLLGQGVVLRRRRAAEFPSNLITALLIGFTLLWAGDGINSYMAIFPSGFQLYEPSNWLRLITGALNGLTMSAFIYPIFNITLWRHMIQKPAIRGLRDLIVLLLLEGGMVGLVLARWDFLLYPLALLSALGVLTLLTSVNSVLVVMMVRRENRVDGWREALIPLLAGFTLSMIQVGAIDLIRYAVTGTLEGFPMGF